MNLKFSNKNKALEFSAHQIWQETSMATKYDRMKIFNWYGLAQNVKLLNGKAEDTNTSLLLSECFGYCSISCPSA